MPECRRCPDCDLAATIAALCDGECDDICCCNKSEADDDG